MATVFEELAYSAYLIRAAKAHRASQPFSMEQAVSPQALKECKGFQYSVKRSFQALNTVKGFYVKSLFYNLKDKRLTLYTRIGGIDTAVYIQRGKKDLYFETNTGIDLSYSVRLLCRRILLTYIPSEQGICEKHTAINLLPAYRRNPYSC